MELLAPRGHGVERRWPYEQLFLVVFDDMRLVALVPDRGWIDTSPHGTLRSCSCWIDTNFYYVDNSSSSGMIVLYVVYK